MKCVALSVAGAMAASGFFVLSAVAAPAGPPAPPSFARCAVCHSTAKGAPSRIGPNLFGVAERKAGTLAGYAYSSPLKASGIVWTKPALDRYLANPDAVARGGKMPNPGLTAAERQAIVAYLTKLK